jgi:hypothetical protein
MRRTFDRRSGEPLPSDAESATCTRAGPWYRASRVGTTSARTFGAAGTSDSLTLRTARVPGSSRQQVAAARAGALAILTPWFAGGQQSCSPAGAGAHRHRPMIWSEKTKARVVRSVARYRTRAEAGSRFMTGLILGGGAVNRNEPQVPLMWFIGIRRPGRADVLKWPGKDRIAG